MTIRVVVADDEPEARDGLVRLVAAEEDLTLVAQCGDGRAALDAIMTHGADIVLLDVEMPGLNGLDVVRSIDAPRMPVVVFITAFDHYALQAFDARAIGYLVKPFDDDQFRAAMRHAKDIHGGHAARERAGRLDGLIAALDELTRRADDRQPPGSSSAALDRGAEAGPPLTRLLLKSADRIAMVSVADVDWFEAADYYVRVHYGGQRHLIRETMGELDRRLDPARFFRIHRSTIVNLDRVRSLTPAFRGDHIVVLHNGTKLVLSRARKSRFEHALGQRL